MLDINYIRDNAATVRKAAADKLMNVDIDSLLELDALIRNSTSEIEMLRAERNNLSKQIPQFDGEEKSAAIKRVKAIKEKLCGFEEALSGLRKEFDGLMLTVPSIPAPEVPIGKSEEDNVEIRRWRNTKV